MSEGNSRVPDLEPDAMSNNAGGGGGAGTAGCGCVLQPQASSATATSNQLTGPTTSSDPTITISITPTTGGQFDITVDKNESIENLKKIISKRLKVAKERICLLHRERQLRDGTLEENRLQDGSRLTLLPSVETGLLKPRYQVQRGLQHSVLSLQAQRPEQSVMQALESLSDSQVNDFLSGKAPLNLTMRLGDHMMLIQLQLSTVTPANAATAAPATSLPPQPQQQQQQPIQPVQQQEIQQQQQQQQPALDARRSTGVISGSSATTTTTTAAASKLSLSSSLVSKLSAASSLFGVPSPPNTPTSPTAPCCSQQPQQPQQQNFVQPETPPVTPPGRQPQAVPQQQQQKQPPKYRRSSLRSSTSSSRHAFHPYTLLDLNRQTRQATKAAAAATAAATQAPKSCPSCPEASEASSAAAAAAAAPQQQSTPSSPAEPATACCKFSDWSLILDPCDCSKLSPKNKVCASHANSSVPQETSSATASGSPMEVCTPAATTTTTALSAPSTPTSPVTPTSPDSPDTTSSDATGNPTATLDTRALVEASRNLTQKLKQLSSEENAKRRQGAIIESMHHHGKGVYTGTFSGTLNPALQDRHGRPKRDISTIIHILNDLLCATPATTAGHYRYHRHPTTHHRAAASSVAAISSPAATSTGATQTPSMFALTSSGAPGATPAGHAPAGLEATPGCPVSSAPGYSSEELSKENEATKGKMRRLRLVMEQRREKMRARRQARAAPYTTKWAAVTPGPDPNASSSSSSSSSPGSGTSSSDSQNEPELKPCSPEPVVA